MAKKIFVGNLSFQVTDFELNDLFKQYGEVTSAKVVVDRMTGRSRGFGFVEMNSDDGAQSAVDSLNGTEVNGRAINVSFAREKSEGDRSYGGSGGGGFKRKRNFNSY